jgi:hypothetical protein
MRTLPTAAVAEGTVAVAAAEAPGEKKAASVTAAAAAPLTDGTEAGTGTAEYRGAGCGTTACAAQGTMPRLDMKDFCGSI